MGCKVLFWRESWWEYPKAHHRSRMVPQKPPGVIGEGSNTGEDEGTGKVGRSCANFGLTDPSNSHNFSGYLV